MRHGLFCLVAFALSQNAASLVYDEATCKKVELIATELDLVEEGSPVVDPEDLDMPPCKHAWKASRIVPMRFDEARRGHYAEGYMTRDPALSPEMISGRVLSVPNEVSKHWKHIPVVLYLNEHIFHLAGGIYECLKEAVVFTFIATTSEAYELHLGGQKEKTEVHIDTAMFRCSRYGLLECDVLCHSMKYISSLTKNRGGLRRLEYEWLFYRDVGPIEKIVDFDNIPLYEEQLKNTKFIIPNISDGFQDFLKTPFKTCSVSLIRLVQVIRQFMIEIDLIIPLENTFINAISTSLDMFNKDWSRRETDEFVKGLILEGINLISSLVVDPISNMPHYLQGLIQIDPSLANLFLFPHREDNELQLFDLTNIDGATFDGSALGKILPYAVKGQTVPLLFELNVKGRNEYYVLFAFISHNNILHFFKRQNDSRITLNIHGSNEAFEGMYLETKLNDKDLILEGWGVAFYRHCASSFATTKVASRD